MSDTAAGHTLVGGDRWRALVSADVVPAVDDRHGEAGQTQAGLCVVSRHCHCHGSWGGMSPVSDEGGKSTAMARTLVGWWPAPEWPWLCVIDIVDLAVVTRDLLLLLVFLRIVGGGAVWMVTWHRRRWAARKPKDIAGHVHPASGLLLLWKLLGWA